MIKKRLLTVGAALLMAIGVGAVTMPETAFASWHDASCPVYHLGRLCIYDGYNGGGDRYVYPEATTYHNACIVLGDLWVNNLMSFDYDMVDYSIQFYATTTCVPSTYLGTVFVWGRYDHDQFTPDLIWTEAIKLV